MKTPSLAKVKKYVRRCFDRLGMSHWEVVTRWMTKEEAEGEFARCNGFTYWNAEHCYAEVVISRESEDWRHTCRHESLHVRIEGHMPMRKRRDIALEVTINALSKALSE